MVICLRKLYFLGRKSIAMNILLTYVKLLWLIWNVLWLIYHWKPQTTCSVVFYYSSNCDKIINHAYIYIILLYALIKVRM